MNQNNGKNSMGLDSCFEEHENPIDLFKKWFDKAKENEINDPNALALATSGLNNQPNVRMVLLKGISSNGFVFFTNFNSKKGDELKNNQKASMCFHWKSLRRQVRILGRKFRFLTRRLEKPTIGLDYWVTQRYLQTGKPMNI